MSLPPFHLAFAVDDLDEARRFYGGLLGCREGRRSEHWIDFDFYGHQIVAHLAPGGRPGGNVTPVDGADVPVPHFGVVLPLDAWRALAERLVEAGTRFIIPPSVRFKGEPGEQATMFLLDLAGNALEFKAMAKPDNLFARD